MTTSTPQRGVTPTRKAALMHVWAGDVRRMLPERGASVWVMADGSAAPSSALGWLSHRGYITALGEGHISRVSITSKALDLITIEDINSSAATARH